MWYHENVGEGECAVVDTYWQTETGSIIITPLPGAVQTKPGSATLPFFGIEPVLLDPTSGKEIDMNGKSVEGVLAIKKPWPSIARTVFGDHARYLETYLKPCAYTSFLTLIKQALKIIAFRSWLLFYGEQKILLTVATDRVPPGRWGRN